MQLPFMAEVLALYCPSGHRSQPHNDGHLAEVSTSYLSPIVGEESAQYRPLRGGLSLRFSAHHDESVRQNSFIVAEVPASYLVSFVAEVSDSYLLTRIADVSALYTANPDLRTI